jgi:hypothetical protein
MSTLSAEIPPSDDPRGTFTATAYFNSTVPLTDLSTIEHIPFKPSDNA